MGNALKKPSTPGVVTYSSSSDDETPMESDGADISIRIIPDDDDASHHSNKRCSLTASKQHKPMHTSLSTSALSSLVPSLHRNNSTPSSLSSDSRTRATKSLSLRSISVKSWAHNHDRNGSGASSRIPSPATTHGSIVSDPSRSAMDILSDALKVAQLEQDRNATFEIGDNSMPKHHDFMPKHDFLEEYHENIEIDEVGEADIEQRRYYLFQRVWRHSFQSPVQQPEFIIHWSCGAGPWENRVVQEYPQCKVVDIDYKPPMLLNATPSPRIEYRQLSIAKRTKDHGLADYQDNTVDLVLLRNIWLLGADTSQWREILRHIFRILKPGGWIELYDQDRPVVVSCGSPDDCRNIYKLEGWRATARTILSVEWMDMPQIRDLMLQAGFTNINNQSVDLPVGEWPRTPDLKETGYLVKDLRRRHAKHLKRWICEANHISEEEFSDVLNNAQAEVETCKGHTSWLCSNAQKPL